MPDGDDPAQRPDSGVHADTAPREFDIADDISALSPINEERDRSRSVHGDPNEGKPKPSNHDGTVDMALQLLILRQQQKKKASEAKKEAREIAASEGKNPQEVIDMLVAHLDDGLDDALSEMSWGNDFDAPTAVHPMGGLQCIQ